MTFEDKEMCQHCKRQELRKRLVATLPQLPRNKAGRKKGTKNKIKFYTALELQQREERKTELKEKRLAYMRKPLLKNELLILARKFAGDGFTAKQIRILLSAEEAIILENHVKALKEKV